MLSKLQRMAFFNIGNTQNQLCNSSKISFKGRKINMAQKLSLDVFKKFLLFNLWKKASVMQSWICILFLGKKKNLNFIHESQWVTDWLYEPPECFELFSFKWAFFNYTTTSSFFLTRKCACIPVRSPLANSLYPQKLVCLPASDSTEEELQFFPFDDFLALVLMFANLG